METILEECIEHIMMHLHPIHVNRLVRTCKRLKQAVIPFEEQLYSGTRLVQMYRSASVTDGMIQLTWIRNTHPYFDAFRTVPLIGAKDILLYLWNLRVQNDTEHKSLFVYANIYPNVLPCDMPVYLFKTMAFHHNLIQNVQQSIRSSEASIIDPWPVYIACRTHSYRYCNKCPKSERFLHNSVF